MHARGARTALRAAPVVLAVALLLGADPAAQRRSRLSGPPAGPFVLSVIGTNDLHGAVFERDGRGGLAVLGGYVKNLRAARAADGGAVLLLDAGDTFQGTVESNLSEGALVVDAYNALGYAAAAIGNHEFDFGAVDADTPGRGEHGDPRGALKARAAQARYPFLAANLLDAATGRQVDWPNVKPSAMVEAGGVKIGLIGVMTAGALRATLTVNTRGLLTSPLAPAIATEAAALRANGAGIVIVAAHAGGRCTSFDDPGDLSSCEPSSEIFEVARALPRGAVDVIVAGHAHAGLAHRVEGIAIIEAHSHGRAFGRVDLVVDRRTGRIADVRFFAPQDLVVPGTYEGRAVARDPAVTAAMAPALRRVRSIQDAPLGVRVEGALRRTGDPESALGNLFADALRESEPGADVAVSNTSNAGGLRADLLDGPLTFGRLYDVFPFDNRVVRLTLTAGELTRVFADELDRGRRGALAVSGIRLRAGCAGHGLRVELRRASGAIIGAAERLVVVTTDFLAAGAVFAAVAPPGGFPLLESSPIAREVVANWLIRRGGWLNEALFVHPAHRRWEDASPC